MSGCDSCAPRPAPGGPVAVQLRSRPEPAATAAPPWYHVLRGDRDLVLLMQRSALFEVEAEFADRLARHDADAEAELAGVALAGGIGADPMTELGPLPALRSISLNVAQACNLTCSYCYADEGRFHGRARLMHRDVARRAVSDLIRAVASGERVTVGFIGGEPMLNRDVVHDTVRFASEQARTAGVRIAFSMTTNATLLEPADLDLFRAHPFTITASLDGDADTHDRHRAGRDGGGSWQRAVDRLAPLLADPGGCGVSARATVTRDRLNIAERVAALLAVGFREVGVSPARTGPDLALLLRDRDWPAYLAGLVEAADAEIERLRQHGGASFAFANLGNALHEIHRGTARPLPCGAGYGYASVDVDGTYSTCHRTVGDPRWALGPAGELSDGARMAFVQPRLVDRQEPCRSCWARYLCGGGCHAEVAQVGRDSCDMIRGWLEHCLLLYPGLLAEFPALFGSARVQTSR